MKLKQLCKDIPGLAIRPFKDVEISGITSNSKQVLKNSLFIAKKGKTHDGASFIREAVLNGASVVATDVYDPTLQDVVQLIYPDVNRLLALLSARYYGAPSQELWMVAITGTCGKTTTSYAIKHVLEQAYITCGLIGTIEYMVGRKSYSATHTTPDVCENIKLLRQMQLEGCQACVMEVTSHALDQGRVDGIEFDVAVFTNLTHEHLDYHKTMEEYFTAKSKLFSNLKTEIGSKKSTNVKVALINSDDPWKEKCIAATHSEAQIVTFGIERRADIQASEISFTSRGTNFTVSYQGKSQAFFWPLVGRFNVYNALAAIGVLLTKGLSLDEIAHHLRSFVCAPGRLDPVVNRLGVHIFVDYAHKPQALEYVLKTLKEIAERKIIVVFGCGGDRDRQKRPVMGKIAQDGADYVIVTSDNPRSEDPNKIVEEIVSGMQEEGHFEVEVDRKRAIYKALCLAEPGDIVLIAGRGHETKQLFSKIFVDFDDKEVAHRVAEELYHKNTIHMSGR